MFQKFLTTHLCLTDMNVSDILGSNLESSPQIKNILRSSRSRIKKDSGNIQSRRTLNPTIKRIQFLLLPFLILIMNQILLHHRPHITLTLFLWFSKIRNIIKINIYDGRCVPIVADGIIHITTDPLPPSLIVNLLINVPITSHSAKGSPSGRFGMMMDRPPRLTKFWFTINPRSFWIACRPLLPESKTSLLLGKIVPQNTSHLKPLLIIIMFLLIQLTQISTDFLHRLGVGTITDTHSISNLFLRLIHLVFFGLFILTHHSLLIKKLGDVRPFDWKDAVAKDLGVKLLNNIHLSLLLATKQINIAILLLRTEFGGTSEIRDALNIKIKMPTLLGLDRQRPIQIPILFLHLFEKLIIRMIPSFIKINTIRFGMIFKIDWIAHIRVGILFRLSLVSATSNDLMLSRFGMSRRINIFGLLAILDFLGGHRRKLIMIIFVVARARAPRTTP